MNVYVGQTVCREEYAKKNSGYRDLTDLLQYMSPNLTSCEEFSLMD